MADELAKSAQRVQDVLVEMGIATEVVEFPSGTRTVLHVQVIFMEMSTIPTEN